MPQTAQTTATLDDVLAELQKQTALLRVLALLTLAEQARITPDLVGSVNNNLNVIVGQFGKG